MVLVETKKPGCVDPANQLSSELLLWNSSHPVLWPDGPKVDWIEALTVSEKPDTPVGERMVGTTCFALNSHTVATFLELL